MRPLFLFATLSIAALGSAQMPAWAPEREIWDAYQNFRDADAFRIDMVGKEVYGKTEVPVHAILFWKRSVDARTGLASRVQVELDVFTATKTGEALTMRIVGDGVNLYRYDLVRGEVSTTTYGFYGKQTPPQYPGTDAPKLLSQLTAAAPGHTAYLVRLLAELNPSGDLFTARYARWLPLAKESVLSFDSVPLGPRDPNGPVMEDDTVTDPITGLVFPRGADRYVFFGYDRPAPDRTVAFHLYDVNNAAENPLWQVDTVTVSLRSPGRVVGLTLTPRTATIPAGTFVPESGYFRPISRGR